ncbi:PA14 domain-containing protein, partial [Aquibacillus koreensis]
MYYNFWREGFLVNRNNFNYRWLYSSILVILGISFLFIGSVSAAEKQWTGSFFDQRNLSGNSEQVSMDKINFDWGYNAPSDTMPHYNFSATLKKTIEGEKDYFVQTYADDGIRVKAGNQVLIDRWSGSAGTYNQA